MFYKTKFIVIIQQCVDFGKQKTKLMFLDVQASNVEYNYIKYNSNVLNSCHYTLNLVIKINY